MNEHLLQLRGEVSIQAAAGDGKRPTFRLVAYDGKPMVVSGFGTIIVDLTGADVAGTIPILESHGETLDNIVGQGTARIESNTIVVAGNVTDATPSGQKVLALAKSGIALQASIGFSPSKREHVRAGENVRVNGGTFTAAADGLTVIRAGKLREVSLVPVGAAGETYVQIAAKSGFNAKGTQRMANEQDLLSPENIARVNASLPDEMRCAWDRSGMTDDQRVEARLAAFRKDYGDVLPDFGGGMVRAAVSGSLTWPDAEREILRAEVRAMKLREIRAHYATAPAIHGSSRDTNQEILQAALCLNTGALKEPEKQFTPQVLEAASSPAYRHFGLQQLLVAAAMENGFTARPGEGVNRGNLRAVLEYAFPARPAITAGFSTHSITTMLSTVGNKILLDGFAAAPQKWREIAATKTVTDFKQTTAFRMTADLEYEELPPAGEIKHGTLGQESYTMQARTYAKMLTLTRTEIINDDLGAFDDLRNRLGIGAVIKMNKIFWTAWINNVAFFTAERGNYMEGAATTLDETGLNAAVKLFRDLQSPDGDTLDLEPAILLVPSDLEATALKWYNATEIRNPAADTPTPTENIFKGRFRPVVVPQLSRSAYTGYSAKAWYLLADPKILATAAMCFLNGMESPTIESADADFNTLGIQFRGYHDFGVSMTEYRAGVKIKGEV